MTGYNIVNLSDLLEELGEDRVKSILSSFSSINEDVEEFIKYKAIEFSKQGIAKTHLIFSSYKGEPVLIAYFTLSNKFIMVKTNALSKTLKRKISRYAKIDNQTKQYTLAAPLIAQLGKNYTNSYRKLISGDELLTIACDKVKEMQKVVGGKFVYLECEDMDFLNSFYKSNGFICFGRRVLDGDETDKFEGQYLNQMLKFLK